MTFTVPDHLEAGSVDPKFVRRKDGDDAWEYVAGIVPVGGSDSLGIGTGLYRSLYRRPAGSDVSFQFVRIERISGDTETI